MPLVQWSFPPRGGLFQGIRTCPGNSPVGERRVLPANAVTGVVSLLTKISGRADDQLPAVLLPQPLSNVIGDRVLEVPRDALAPVARTPRAAGRLDQPQLVRDGKGRPSSPAQRVKPCLEEPVGGTASSVAADDSVARERPVPARHLPTAGLAGDEATGGLRYDKRRVPVTDRVRHGGAVSKEADDVFVAPFVVA